ncbi:MAG TPA: hypothetical protein DCL01_02305, partial [Thauera sp.]|nr:hypothetical protein [Thauera sp.]
MRAEHRGARRLSELQNFDDCLSADRPRLRRMARDLTRAVADRRRGHRAGETAPGGGSEGGRERSVVRIERLQADFDALLARSRAALLARRAALPMPDFPPELPVSARRDEIAEAMAAHQVIIVCGETG